MNMSIGLVNRALSCAFLGFLLSASPGFAQPVRNRPSQPARPAGNTRATRDRETPFVPNRYILFLQDDPVAARVTRNEDLQTATAVAYRQQVEARQQSVKRDLANRNIKVVGSVSTLLNAVFVVAGPERLAELRSLAGVAGVMPERRVKTSLNRATSLANAPAAWAQAAIGGQANAGNGVKIGILDTGIDQTNPAFNDAGYTLPAGFPKCNAASDCANFTNKKVIVARSYVPQIAAGSNPANPSADSLPDDFSARDRDGHGSAVAAVAAASQTNSQTGGPTVSFSGMAPKAYLGSYKIFGSPGVSGSASESVLIQALDDAVTDGMNVVNMSSGVPAFTGALDVTQCGNTGTVPCDPLATAFEAAAKNGLVITLSVGNNGEEAYQYPYYEGFPYFNSITSPATAPSVIGVGATVNSHVFNPAVTVLAANAPSSLKGIVAAMSDAYFYPSYVGSDTGSLVDVAQVGPDGYACTALPANSLNGKYALIQDGGTCSGNYDQKAINATNAGAIGIIYYMATSAALINPEAICGYDSSGNYYCDQNGPAVMISLSAGQALKTYIDANPGATVLIDTAGSEQLVPSVTNELASFSSFGPTPDGAIKPDLVATGGYDYYIYPDVNDTLLPAPNGLYTVGQSYDPNGQLYTTNGYVAVDGTSVSAPLVAGAAALVKQVHPTWTATQIKSALVNYSAQDVTEDTQGLTEDVEGIGAGRLDANAALNATVTAEPSTLSFAYLKTGVAFPKPIAVTVTNKGASSVTLAVAVAVGVAATGASVSTDHTSLTIAGCTAPPACPAATLNVTLSGTVPAAGGEYNGAVTLTSSSPAVSLRIPYMFLVGDGSFPNVVPLYGNGYYGAVGQDLGPIPVQVVDQWGVPVTGTTVTFSVSPSGSVTLKSVTGVAGSTTGVNIPFVPSNCSPASSSTSVSCTTNSYGIAWIEVVGGTTTYDYYTNPATIDVVAAGQDIPIYVGLLPVPALQTVQDGGAFGNTIAPGSYVSLFGSNLLDPTNLSISTGDSASVSFTNGILPLTLDGVTVSFDAAATAGKPAISVPGYVYFVSTTQVNVWVPYELQGYPSAQVKVTFSGGVRSNVVTVPLNNYVPAFLMYGSGNVFIADAVDGVDCPSPYIIGTACPATRGKLISLYVNGLGPVTNQPASGNPALASPLSQVSPLPVVMIGGQQATVQFAGLAPTYVGLYQVNVYVPTNIGTGNQPITISVGGKTSPGSITGGGTKYNIVIPVQ
jgi:uncharacterized protein (TIGR03437 family)